MHSECQAEGKHYDADAPGAAPTRADGSHVPWWRRRGVLVDSALCVAAFLFVLTGVGLQLMHMDVSGVGATVSGMESGAGVRHVWLQGA